MGSEGAVKVRHRYRGQAPSCEFSMESASAGATIIPFMTWAFRPFPGGRHGQEQNAPTRPSGRIAALLAVFPFVERVTGIGGVFFRSKDPERLAAWYEEHLA